MDFRNMAWRDDAACRDEDTAIWFPETDDDMARAMAFCAACPVREQCLEFALDTRQVDGVWGGLTEPERRRARRRRLAVAREQREATTAA